MSDSTQTQIELSRALARCLLRDKNGSEARELVCEVDTEAWAKAVAKPVDEVTSEPADGDDHADDQDEDGDRQETVLSVEGRVEEAVNEKLREAGVEIE